MSSPIPVLLCGKIPTHIAATTEIMKPDFEVIHVCTDPSSVIAFLESVLSDQPYEGTSHAKPRIVIMGGGYTNENLEAAQAVHGSKGITWLRPKFTKPGFEGDRPAAPPSAEVIAGWARKAVDENLDDIKNGGLEGEIIWF